MPNETSTTFAEILPAQPVPQKFSRLKGVWQTDWTRATVDLDEISFGILQSDPRDVIRPIDAPRFEAVADSGWLTDDDPGVVFEVGDLARFYPLRIMGRHEIVNDDFDGTPIVITYCPLCNTALVFDPIIEGATHRFGVSGLLRNSDLIMWDDQTESLWQQITGEAIVGEMAGRRMAPLPAAIVSWGDFRADHPDGEVLAADQGMGQVYTGYVAYYQGAGDVYRDFDADGERDTIPGLERVVGLSLPGGDKAYPFSLLSGQRVVHDRIGGQEVVILWGSPSTKDALSNRSPELAAETGTGIAFSRLVEGKLLTFEPVSDSTFRDLETGSTWTILGKAVAGKMRGAELEMLPHRNEFWFAWASFFPDAPVWGAT